MVISYQSTGPRNTSSTMAVSFSVKWLRSNFCFYWQSLTRKIHLSYGIPVG